MKRKDANPSVYTILYWLIQDKKIEAEIFFKFLELFWPNFVEKHGFVFLKENYSEEKFAGLIKEEFNPEYWINLLTVDDFFSDIEQGEEKASSLAKALVDIWETKLKKEFPEKKFVVMYLHDEDTGDQGLTFFSQRKSKGSMHKKVKN